MIEALDRAWCHRHPLPASTDSDKDDRGTTLIIGGSAFVPGAPILTGEAALRVGAGKVQMAVPDASALAIGLSFPECAVIGLSTDSDGEIAASGADRLSKYVSDADAIVVGPGMGGRAQTAEFVDRLFLSVSAGTSIVLDAGAMTVLSQCAKPPDNTTRVLTPHHGELATLMEVDKDAVARDPERSAVEAARRFNAVVVLKSKTTFIALADGTTLRFEGPAPGLGTAGSGDVLAGAIGGFLARGLTAADAAAWGVWLHAAAGVAAGAKAGTIGYLARDLLPFLSQAMEGAPSVPTASVEG